MIIEILGGAGVVAALYEYFTNASFKAKVLADVKAAQAEVATLKTKAAGGVAVVESDFVKIETAVKTLLAKL